MTTDPRTPEQHWQDFKRSATTEHARGVVAYVEARNTLLSIMGEDCEASIARAKKAEAERDALRAEMQATRDAWAEKYNDLARQFDTTTRHEVEQRGRAERAEAAVAAMRAERDDLERARAALAEQVVSDAVDAALSADVGAGMVSAPTAQAMAEALRDHTRVDFAIKQTGCPACGLMARDGHEDDCAIALALDAYEREVKR